MDAEQAGAQGIVTSLHHIPAGVAWTSDEILARQDEVRTFSNGALEWEVVESLPVSEVIKTKGAEFSDHVRAYSQSLEALARRGLRTICYNFMPVLDWTRTHLRWPLGNGGRTMRFDLPAFAVFDRYILDRRGASEDYDDEIRGAASRLFMRLTENETHELSQAVTAGLPGAVETWSVSELKAALESYAEIDEERFRQNHIDFLSDIAPTAERLGLRMCCHPDDPPFSILGLPRIMSTADDYAQVLGAVDTPSIGMTLCTGSLGANPENDCVEIARRFAPKIHFVHLRNVTRDRDSVPCSFTEDEHLAGQVDMVGVIGAILDEEARRRGAGADWVEIPMRPDHGQEILADLTSACQPGYPAVGRLKGLAEIRGVAAALTGNAAHV